jgi:MFS transporter, PPP family, 3-phenylpropionic acid transporter
VGAFFILYVAMYAAFGVASPFLPAFIVARGLPADGLGVLLAVGIGVRMLAAPFAGRVADATHAHRWVLAACATLAAFAGIAYLPARSGVAIVLVSLLHAAALAPVTGVADALALSAASSEEHGFEYGWVRGAGSAAFVVGVLSSGQAVKIFGLTAIVVAQAMLLVVTAIAAALVADRTGHRPRERRGAVGALVRVQRFRRLLVVAALVLGSHALHDGFAVIRWGKAGIGPAGVSVLWSESVASEVLVFFVIGPRLLTRLEPRAALAIAACAGIVRWVVAARTTHVVALALVQPLHGATFALLHLASMRLLRVLVPAGLEATAQAVYGTIAIGGATALLTLASGALYARFDTHAFWAMAALCAAALPLTWTLRTT